MFDVSVLGEEYRSSGCVSELDVSVYELDAAALAADALRLEIRKKTYIFVLAPPPLTTSFTSGTRRVR